MLIKANAVQEIGCIGQLILSLGCFQRNNLRILDNKDSLHSIILEISSLPSLVNAPSFLFYRFDFLALMVLVNMGIVMIS